MFYVLVSACIYLSPLVMGHLEIIPNIKSAQFIFFNYHSRKKISKIISLLKMTEMDEETWSFSQAITALSMHRLQTSVGGEENQY